MLLFGSSFSEQMRLFCFFSEALWSKHYCLSLSVFFSLSFSREKGKKKGYEFKELDCAVYKQAIGFRL